VSLWVEHTTRKEQQELWFKMFDGYLRTKLYNALNFSYEYFIHLANDTDLNRPDLARYLTKYFTKVKREYVDELDREQDWYENNLDTLTKDELQELQKIKKRLDVAVNGSLTLAVRNAPYYIKLKHLGPKFFKKCWSCINKDHYFLKMEKQRLVTLTEQELMQNMEEDDSPDSPTKRQRRRQSAIDGMSLARLDSAVQKLSKEGYDRKSIKSHKILASVNFIISLMAPKTRNFKRLLRMIPSCEERIQLWGPLHLSQKLEMLAHQRIPHEADVMTLLFYFQYCPNIMDPQLLNEADIRLERALDSQIYDKYRLLMEI